MNSENMTDQEQRVWERLPIELQQFATVSMSYQSSFQIINKHLQTIYGDRAEWEKCLAAYQKSSFYRQGSHIVRKCDDLRLVTTDELRVMLDEEEKYRTTAAALVRMLPDISNEDKAVSEKATDQIDVKSIRISCGAGKYRSYYVE